MNNYTASVVIGSLCIIAGIALATGSPGPTLIATGVSILFVTGCVAVANSKP